MIKVIKNGTVITMDEKRKEKYEKLDIVIKDDTIIKIEENYTGNADEIIDATNKIVMPGLVNSHTHLGMSIFRCTNDNYNLNDWLTKKIWPIEDKMSWKDIYYTTLLSCIESIKSGTTTSADHYFGTLESINAIKECKIREIFTNCCMDSDNNGNDRLEIFEKLYNENKDISDLITFSVAPHALYTCSSEYLEKLRDVAIKYNLPIHIHMSENLDEVQSITEKYGMKPAFVLKELGLLKCKLVLAHCTYLDDDEINLLSKYDVSIVHNPISNLNLGCGIAPIKKYIDNGINVCLGTDGAGSAINIDMFYHMAFVDLLQKGLYKDPTIINAYDVLKIATINGAKAFNLDNKIGSIEVGKKADIILLDYNDISVYPTADVISQVVHNTRNYHVTTSIINGEVIMKDRKLTLNIDEEKLKQKIDNIISKLY